MKHLPQIRFITLSFFLLTVSVCAIAQQPTESAETARERGIQFYNQGDYEKAVEALQNALREKENDYLARRYLGLSFYNQEMYSSALNAFNKLNSEQMKSPELMAKYSYASLLANSPVNALNYARKAINAGIKTAEMYYVLCESNFQQNKYEEAMKHCNDAIEIDSNYAYSYLTKSMVLLNLRRDEESADCLEKFLQLKPFDEDARVWVEQIAELRKDNTKTQLSKTQQSNDGNNESDSPSTAKAVSQKAMVTFKPQPEYAEKARVAGQAGIVRIRAVLSSDGSIKHIIVIKPLRFGLTTKAVNATKSLEFKPATKDGKPVSQYVTLEYNFRIY